MYNTIILLILLLPVITLAISIAAGLILNISLSRYRKNKLCMQDTVIIHSENTKLPMS